MNYEYSFLHWTGDVTPLLIDSSEVEAADWFQQMLDEILDSLASQVDTHKGGGWEVLSHDFQTISERILLVTVFLRRPAS